MKSFQIILAMSILALVSACATKPAVVDAALLTPVKTVELVVGEIHCCHITIGSLERYREEPMQGGIVRGILIDQTDEKSKVFASAARSRSTEIEKTFLDGIRSGLERSGYRVITRTKGQTDQGTVADAVLEVTLRAGYFAYGVATPYRRQIDVTSVLKVSGTGKVIVATTHGFNGTFSSVPRQFAYSDFEMLSANLEEALAGLAAWIGESARYVGANFTVDHARTSTPF